ncbi:hypothetical protein BDR07DRAFT_1498621 [Suillus spraguei]|nr:hypothetical protein BDR07DRAFT_1498621 [Suillus spraguei]
MVISQDGRSSDVRPTPEAPDAAALSIPTVERSSSRRESPQGPGRAFTRYPPSEYIRNYHDSRMPHAPQPSGRTQPTHGPPAHGPQLPLQYGENEHQAGPSYPRNGGYHEAPYHDPRDGFDGYREDFWHPPSSLYYGVGGMYQDGYGREYPNDSDNGGRAP